MLWVPSLRDYHLVGPQKRAFLVVPPSFWNFILPRYGWLPPSPFAKRPPKCGLGTTNGNTDEQVANCIIAAMEVG